MMEVRIPGMEKEDTLPLQVEFKSLPPQKVEAKSFCLLEEAGLSQKLSA